MANGERGVYSPPPDDEYEAREGGRRGMVLLAVSVLVLLAAAAMAWSAYNLGLREGGRDAPPRIVADSGPFRSEPADPGGFQAPGQDIEVYDTLSGEQRETAERFAPPPETPLEAALDAPVIGAPDPDPRGVQIVEEAPTPPPPAQQPAQQAMQQLELPAAQQPAPPAVQQPAVTASSGAWLVQLAALRSEEEARATWNRVTSAHPSIMAGAALDVQRADLGERGVYYRARAGGFATREAAETLCNRLKAAGQDCIVVAR